ncbi:acetate--CoA ligase family protein [Mesorhizobium sp. CAU 1741]|uniref:acetate--CoA ligase family protein n=1 Tax=Mesorhizobium sp. CAU 1741 TaxID=3140366 RepID=UPI00325BD736
MTTDLLKALIDPATVALIGASDNPAKLTARPMRFLEQNGFAGRICPVNPARDTVLGKQAFASVGAIPGGVDHAYVLVPTEAVVDAVRECAEAGVKVVSVLADGFAEAGEAGRARQAEVAAIADEAGILLVGPNSMGVVNTANGFVCTTNAAFAAARIATGTTAVLSQSGSIIGTLLSRGAQKGLAFSRLVSLGNEACAGVGRIGLSLLDDPGTDSFALFLETIRDADALAEFGHRAARLGKPVVAYMLGRSDEGKALAVSHTGALTGSSDAVASFLSANGIRRVDLLDTFLEAPSALARTRVDPARPRHATVVSTTGGGGAMVIDQLSLRSVAIAPCSPASRATLEAQKIALGHGKLVDVTLAGARYETMKAVVSTLMRDPETGILVVATGSSAQFNPELAVKPVADALAEAPEGCAPVVAVPLPHAPESLQMLRDAGISAFGSIEAAAEVIAMMLVPFDAGQRPQPVEVPAETTALLDEACDGGNATLDESASGRIFASLGATLPRQVHLAPDAALSQAADLDYPVVAKLVSPDLPHKTEAGAITIGVGSLDELQAAIVQMRASASRHSPGFRDRGVLVQEMKRGLGEALVGMTRDPLVGPVLTIGAGGTLAEVYGDVAVHPIPLTLADAQAMIDRIKGFAPLRGYRGARKGDLDALARFAVDVSRLMLDPRVAEAELNPVMIGPQGEGVVAVDALVHLGSAPDVETARE